MRRSDREVAGLQNIVDILDKCEILRLGVCRDDKPYIVPMNFAYEIIDERLFIYLHCASEGKKLDIISENNNVCFEADCSYKILEAEDACGWSAEYESVIGEGNINVLAQDNQKVDALNIFMKRYGYNGTPNYNQKALSAVTVLQVSVTSITGKHRIK